MPRIAAFYRVKRRKCEGNSGNIHLRNEEKPRQSCEAWNGCPVRCVEVPQCGDWVKLQTRTRLKQDDEQNDDEDDNEKTTADSQGYYLLIK